MTTVVLPKPLRIVFMGTPDFAVPALEHIIDAGFDVRAVYTRAPSAKGRGLEVQKTPVHICAETYDIPVFTPKSFRKNPDEARNFIDFCVRQRIDVAVVVAYGLILPHDVLNAPQKYGCLNIHASLLPRWRGASPIHHMIWSGDKQGGVTIMQMDVGLDTGDMIVKDSVGITDTMTTQDLHDILAPMGARLIVGVLNDIAAGKDIPRVHQNADHATHAPMLKKEDGRVDWNQAASQIDWHIRALNPWPGTFTALLDGQIVKILAGACTQGHQQLAPGTLLNRDGHVACGEGSIIHIARIQTSTGRKMDIASAINGGLIMVGDVFQ